MDSTILLDESVFDETFIPQRLVSRDNHIKEIARCLSPAKSGKTARNLFIYGPPGVGKTLVCKWIQQEHFPNSVYVNCWSKRSSHKVMEEILHQAGFVVHGRESTSELVKKLEKSRKKIIVWLDELDHLDDSDILYVLARNACGLVLISNQPYLPSDVDRRVASRLLLNEIEFKPYNKDEIFDILKERVSYGLRPNTINDDLLSIVSGMCSGDARIGLQIVKNAAKDAESKRLGTITIEEIKSAAKSARKYRLSYLLGKLNEHQRIIYEILKKNRRMDSGKLFEEYRKSVREIVTDRSYRNYMKRLVELELVKVEGEGRWKVYEIV